MTEGGEPFLPHVQALVDSATPISVYEYWQLNKKKVAAQQAYHNMWNSMRSSSGKPVDVLLVPTMPHTALPHRGCRWVGYTKLFNVLDYTALSFPAGKASKELDGHHVGLQIVGRRFEEEKVLGAAKQFESILSGAVAGSHN